MITELPDSQAFTALLTQNIRTAELVEYGKDRLPAGPDIDESDEIMIVEGRADVVNLLKYGIRNVISMKGAKPTDTIIDLTKKKITTLFLDGDRGGDLIIKNLAGLTELDFVCRAPDGKEVEELQQKEILKALRLKVPWDQAKSEVRNGNSSAATMAMQDRTSVATAMPVREIVTKDSDTMKQVKAMRTMADELLGTRGAFILDEQLNVLGRVPVKELESTLQEIDGVYAVVMDGEVTQGLAKIADSNGIKYIVAQSAIARPLKARIITAESA